MADEGIRKMVHVNGNVVWCLHCRIPYTNSMRFETHGGVDDVFCNFCPGDFRMGRDCYPRHVACHHPEEWPDQIVCRKRGCGFHYKKRDKVLRHESKPHLYCSACDVETGPVFYGKNQLAMAKRHTEEHPPGDNARLIKELPDAEDDEETGPGAADDHDHDDDEEEEDVEMADQDGDEDEGEDEDEEDEEVEADDSPKKASGSTISSLESIDGSSDNDAPGAGVTSTITRPGKNRTQAPKPAAAPGRVTRSKQKVKDNHSSELIYTGFRDAGTQTSDTYPPSPKEGALTKGAGGSKAQKPVENRSQPGDGPVTLTPNTASHEASDRRHLNRTISQLVVENARLKLQLARLTTAQAEGVAKGPEVPQRLPTPPTLKRPRGQDDDWELSTPRKNQRLDQDEVPEGPLEKDAQRELDEQVATLVEKDSESNTHPEKQGPDGNAPEVVSEQPQKELNNQVASGEVVNHDAETDPAKIRGREQAALPESPSRKRQREPNDEGAESETPQKIPRLEERAIPQSSPQHPATSPPPAPPQHQQPQQSPLEARQQLELQILQLRRAGDRQATELAELKLGVAEARVAALDRKLAKRAAQLAAAEADKARLEDALAPKAAELAQRDAQIGELKEELYRLHEAVTSVTLFGGD